MSISPYLSKLTQRGREFLGSELAIMVGAMNTDLLRAEIKATCALTTKPFGVNLITMHPQLDALIDVCVDTLRKQLQIRNGSE